MHIIEQEPCEAIQIAVGLSFPRYIQAIAKRALGGIMRMCTMGIKVLKQIQASL
jgi:hypothetical protein